MTLPFLDAESLASALPMIAAVDALEQALLAGLNPAADPARTAVSTPAGVLLVMPSSAGGDLAVKLVSVAPSNPGQGLPRVQGVLVLFDPVTLAPVALVDGIALTSLRTPAVSALAVRQLTPVTAHRLVVFGTGPQAEGHIAALKAVRPIDDVVVIGRDLGRAAALAERAGAPGMAVRVGSTDDVAEADLVVCATTAREPLFDGRLIPDGCCVIAVGSHEPNAREVDAVLVHQSRIIVEDVACALREAGDLIMAGVRADQLQTLGTLVRSGAAVPARTSSPSVSSSKIPSSTIPSSTVLSSAGSSSKPNPQPTTPFTTTLIKTVGMAWEDAVVAAAAVQRWTAARTADR
jgi:ornithine cyclodeaminase/alanine dehydrogenase-like protein (mu-crystallin family)